MTHVELFRSEDAFATSLLLAFVDLFDAEAVGWTPENIDIELQATLGIDCVATNFSKLLSAIHLTTSNEFYHSERVFADICCGISGVLIGDRQLILPTAEEVAWGIVEGGIISAVADGQEPEKFDVAIDGYIRETMHRDGISRPPAFTGAAAATSQDFSDDPEMFSAIWQTQTGIAEELSQWTKSRLQALCSQLKNLQLANGRSEALASDILATRMQQI